MQLHNFNSGPSILPQEVLEQAAKAIHNFNDTGLSILEIGHRTSHFVAVVEEAKAIVKRLMQIGNIVSIFARLVIVPKITRLMLKAYIGPFIITFLIAMFVFEMQFIWLYL